MRTVMQELVTHHSIMIDLLSFGLFVLVLEIVHELYCGRHDYKEYVKQLRSRQLK